MLLTTNVEILILLMLKLEYSDLIRLIPWLLMLFLLVSTDQPQLWHQFNEKEFTLSVPSQSWVMVGDANDATTVLCSIKQIQHNIDKQCVFRVTQHEFRNTWSCKLSVNLPYIPPWIHLCACTFPQHMMTIRQLGWASLTALDSHICGRRTEMK